MKNKIKSTRVVKLSKNGEYPSTFWQLWKKLDDELKQNLSAKSLAKVIDLMEEQYSIGRTHGYNDADQKMEATK